MSVEARRELARRELELRKAKADPLYLMSFMVGTDQRDGTRFDLSHLREPLADGEVVVDDITVRRRDASWRWQRYLAERILADSRLIVLKGRQIGVTWIILAADVAEAILKPGTASLLYRQREDEAIDNVRRWWTLYQSLPSHFKAGIKVLKPSQVPQPGRDGVALLFEDGSISEVVPMSSAVSSGHGRSVRRVLLDEGAYIEKLMEIGAAVEPAAGDAAISIVSTANGRSNEETGEGNEFHRRWVQARAGASGYQALFFPYDVHPERDENWYGSAPEVLALPVHQRHAQFPADEHEAFALSDRNFFDPEDLSFYRALIRKPLYQLSFERKTAQTATVRKGYGPVAVYEEPKDGHQYAIGADVATGRGADFSAATVVDLSNMAVVAEFHAKIDSDLYAYQLHYLGKWFNTAWLAVESAGGFGEAVLIPLRDGREGRPPYPRLYRHVMSSRSDVPVAKPYGFPTNSKTRPLILNQLEKAVRERVLPGVSDRLLWEMEEFVYHDHGTSPRARDGSRDDLVMSTAIALEMFRLYGNHPDQRKFKATRAKLPAGPGTPGRGGNEPDESPFAEMGQMAARV